MMFTHFDGAGAVSVACLAVVHMVKGVDRSGWIDEVHLTSETDGRSGTWPREGQGSGPA